MKIPKVHILFLLLASVLAARCEHLILGDTKNRPLLHHEIAQYNAIPFLSREKLVFYSSQDQRVINSIMVYDNLHSKATATVTAGGVGSTFVNLSLKSERGKGLDYDIGIYA